MQTFNFATRMQSAAWLAKTLREIEEDNEPTLVGFDFAFSYPRGYFELLGVENWRALLEYYAAEVKDNANNDHNRDDFARSINRKIGTGPGPFWGVAKNAACDMLETTRVGRFAFPYHANGVALTEFRHTENAARVLGTIPQSVWKLNQGVAVGGQVIMGLPYLHQLLTQLNSIKAWPFETGWQLDKGTTIHLVEIFPSLVGTDDYARQIAAGEICRDEAQVRACCEYAIELDRAGELEHYFRRPSALDGNFPLTNIIQNHEGWILWSNRQ